MTSDILSLIFSKVASSHFYEMLPSKLADIEPPFTAETIKRAPWGYAGEQPVKQHNSTGGRSHSSVWKELHPHTLTSHWYQISYWARFCLNHALTKSQSNIGRFWKNRDHWPPITSQYLLLIFVIPFRAN